MTNITEQQISVSFAYKGLEFTVRQVRQPSIAELLANGRTPVAADALWVVYALYGNGGGEYEVRADHFGKRERTFWMAKGGVACGYVNMLQGKDGGMGSITSHTGIPLDISPQELLNLFNEAEKEVRDSSLGHLFNCPFSLRGEWRMGSVTVTF